MHFLQMWVLGRSLLRALPDFQNNQGVIQFPIKTVKPVLSVFEHDLATRSYPRIIEEQKLNLQPESQHLLILGQRSLINIYLDS